MMKKVNTTTKSCTASTVSSLVSKVLILSVVTITSGLALADGGPGRPGEGRPGYGRPGIPDPQEVVTRLDRTERLVQQLDERVRMLDDRLRVLEEERRHRPIVPMPPPPAPFVGQFACVLTNPYSNLSYSGNGLNNIDAEFGARKACQDRDGYASGCTSAVRCDQESSPVANKTCMVQNRYSNLTYRGSGKSKIEAEYQAKLACQNSDGYVAGCASGTLTCSQ
jgi:hypothetical protein